MCVISLNKFLNYLNCLCVQRMLVWHTHNSDLHERYNVALARLKFLRETLDCLDSDASVAHKSSNPLIVDPLKHQEQRQLSHLLSVGMTHGQ